MGGSVAAPPDTLNNSLPEWGGLGWGANRENRRQEGWLISEVIFVRS